MALAVLIPPPPLDALVEWIWDWDVRVDGAWLEGAPNAKGGIDRLERILPSAQAQLVINLAEDETRVYDDARRCQHHAAASLGAPSSRSFIIDTREQVAVVGVVFRAGGAAPFFRERMDAMLDAHVDLDALAGDASRALRTRLLEAAGARGRLAVVLAWLQSRVGSARPHAAVAHAVRLLDAAPQVQRIDAIAAECRLSSRRLGELFREQVGLAPKRYVRLRRFQQVLAQVHGQPRVDWAGIAVDCGFHDQPHLVHEFRAFAGMTPGEYLSRQGRWAEHVPLD